MKRSFVIKCSILLFVACLVFAANIYVDPFNVFHWKDARFIPSSPNENFIKTKYVLSVPTKFNAFLFGSSRIGQLTQDCLPETLDGKKLNWYNMTYPTGVPKENLRTMKTFVKNGIKIDAAIVQFDELTMSLSVKKHESAPLTRPYQIYEKNKLFFYINFLKTKKELSTVKQILRYNKKMHESESENFYSYGRLWPKAELMDISKFDESYDPKKFTPDDQWTYTEKESYKDIEELVEFCGQNNIKLFLLTSPLFHATYRVAVDKGYFEFLKKVAQKCEFYNFSSINNFTKDYRYYIEHIHYRPELGALVEKILFGSEEEKSKIREEAGDEFWGEKVNASNVDFIIQKLKEQLPN